NYRRKTTDFTPIIRTKRAVRAAFKTHNSGYATLGSKVTGCSVEKDAFFPTAQQQTPDSGAINRISLVVKRNSKTSCVLLILRLVRKDFQWERNAILGPRAATDKSLTKKVV